jgi:hypothetical protein
MESAGVVELERLETMLLEREQLVPTRSRREVLDALAWLIERRREPGHWGEEDVGATALAVIAIANWSERTPEGKRAVRRQGADDLIVDLAPSLAWLARRADAAGAYATPWYSAVALQAFAAAGESATEPAQRTVASLMSLDPRDGQRWFNHVHHAAQVLEALNAVGMPSEVLAPWADTVAEYVDKDLGAYVCGQALHALVVPAGRGAADFEEIVAYLEGYLRSAPLTLPRFVDSLPALHALCLVDNERDSAAEVVLDKTRELFNKYEPASGWYSNPWYTALALVTLHEIDSDRQIVIDSNSLHDAFRTARRGMPRQERRLRRQAAALSAGLVGLIAVLIALVVLGLWNTPIATIATGIVAGPLALWLANSLRKLLI